MIKDRLAEKEIITKADLYSIVETYYPNIKESAFRNKVQLLREEKVLYPISRGVYSLKAKPNYKPSISDKVNRIYMSIMRKDLSDNLCIWDSSWLNEFMIQQPMKNVITLETDADVLETVYYHLKDNVYRKVFLNPDDKQMEQYVMEEREPVILLPYISRTSYMTINNVVVPVLEKILVDIYFKSELYYWFQGQELINIFEEVNSRYQLKYSTLISYARRRGIHERLKNFLINKTNYPTEIFI